MVAINYLKPFRSRRNISFSIRTGNGGSRMTHRTTTPKPNVSDPFYKIEMCWCCGGALAVSLSISPALSFCISCALGLRVGRLKSNDKELFPGFACWLCVCVCLATLQSFARKESHSVISWLTKRRSKPSFKLIKTSGCGSSTSVHVYHIYDHSSVFVLVGRRFVKDEQNPRRNK